MTLPARHERPCVGFIGLGVMGLPMARNLLSAGYPLIVHNRSAHRASALVGAGATLAMTPAEVAAESDVIVTMLPDSPDVVAVATGASGVLSGAKRGSIWIDMSSIAPRVARELAIAAGDLGIMTLDAPVSGGEIGAIQGTLSIMVGGPQDVLDTCMPILECLAASVVHVGDHGAGQVTKMCNQIIVGGTIALVAEALTLAAKAGASPERVREALLGGFAQSRVLEVHGERMLRRRFDPGFRVRLHQKDLAIGIAAAREYSAAVPLASVTAQLMNVRGDLTRDLDHSAIVTVYELLAATAVGDDDHGAGGAAG